MKEKELSSSVKIIRDPRLEKKLEKKEGEGDFWYDMSDIKKMIKAVKIGRGEEVNLETLAHTHADVILSPGKDPRINLTLPEHRAETVFINVAPATRDDRVSPDDLKTGISNAVDELLKQSGTSSPRTFIFQANVANNHWVTYACNTNGEIMVINSCGGTYQAGDDAAIAGFQEAFEANKDKITAKSPIEPIRITPEQDQKFAQKDGSACGPITVAMSCAIDGNRPFANQRTDLEAEMEKICGGDNPEERDPKKISYEVLREKHRNLIGYFDGIVIGKRDAAQRRPTEDHKAAIAAEVAKPNYPDAPIVDNKPDAPKDDSDSSASQKSQQKQSQVQQNGKKIHPAVVEDCLGKICRQEGLSFIGDNGQYVVGDQGKKIHVEVGKDGKLSASTDDSEMLEKMIKMFAEKMDKLGEQPRELILKGNPQAMQIMKEACAKYNITVVDPNSQQNKKPDDLKKQPEKPPEKPKESKLKIPAPESDSSRFKK